MIKREVSVNGIAVEVEQDLSYGHAGSVWDGALVLAHYFNHMSKRYSVLFSDKSIIELGAGTGILGIATGCFKPKSVIITDFKQNLPLIQKNIKLNHSLGQIFHTQQLAWGDEASMNNLQTKYSPNFLIGSELAYDYQNIQLLLKTIDYYREHNGHLLTVISYQKYEKESVNLAKQLELSNFKFRQVPWNEMDPDFRDKFIGILIIQGKN